MGEFFTSQYPHTQCHLSVPPTEFLKESFMSMNGKRKRFCKARYLTLKHKKITEALEIWRFCLDEQNSGANSLKIYRSEKLSSLNPVDKGKINHELHMACRICGTSLLLCWVCFRKTILRHLRPNYKTTSIFFSLQTGVKCSSAENSAVPTCKWIKLHRMINKTFSNVLLVWLNKASG